jgi:hypothetical protein
MNWEAIGALGEVIAAVVVIATLVYLAIQFRQTIRATHASTFQAATDSFVAINLAIATDEALIKVFSGQRSPETKEDQTRFNFIMLSVFRVRETIFFQTTEGTTDPRSWERMQPGLRQNMQNVHTRDWWNTNSYGFTPEFAAYVNEIVEEINREESA